MKKIVQIFLIFNSLLVNSQSFSMDELKNAVDMNFQDFDKFVSNKGYSYLESKESDYEKSQSFEFLSGKFKYVITLTEKNYINNKVTKISWNIRNSELFKIAFDYTKKNKLPLLPNNDCCYDCRNDFNYKVSSNIKLLLMELILNTKKCSFNKKVETNLYLIEFIKTY